MLSIVSSQDHSLSEKKFLITALTKMVNVNVNGVNNIRVR